MGLTRPTRAPGAGSALALVLGVHLLNRDSIGADIGLLLRLLQGFLDQPHDELPLGKLLSGSGGFPRQVLLETLEKVL